MPARILIIDDDDALLEALTVAFEDAGHAVAGARNGKDGLDRIRGERPDAVVCDVNLPGLDGFALCRKLREEGNGVPLILLTSRQSEIDEALGLELGADDYVTKPFSTRVLLARVASLLRREAARAGGGPAAAARRVGELELDGERLQVRYRGVEVKVTVTEFRMLEVLTRRPGVVLARDRLLTLVRGDEFVDDRLVDTYVRRLRRKLEAADPAFDRIETVIGAGYRWRAEGA